MDIRNTTEGDIGQTGIAHVGGLNRHEYLSIQDAKHAEDRAIASACGWEKETSGDQQEMVVFCRELPPMHEGAKYSIAFDADEPPNAWSVTLWGWKNR
jgi:hypothetical protein